MQLNIKDSLSKVKMYGRHLSEFLLPDQVDILAKSLQKDIEQKLTLTDVVKSLEIKEEIVFEDWLKQHRFTKDINDYVKNNITYREWEVFNMYTMDVYSL